MKLQSLDGAVPTAQMLQAIAEPPPGDDEAKLGIGHCLAVLAQLTVALVGCGAVHWVMN